MKEALDDISGRPMPDVTGAIQHAMAVLEAAAREVTGQPKPTLGKLVPMLSLPAPLDQAVHRPWGYASDRGRHVREGQSVDTTDRTDRGRRRLPLRAPSSPSDTPDRTILR